jgi:hypothetical protein
MVEVEEAWLSSITTTTTCSNSRHWSLPHWLAARQDVGLHRHVALQRPGRRITVDRLASVAAWYVCVCVCAPLCLWWVVVFVYLVYPRHLDFQRLCEDPHNKPSIYTLFVHSYRYIDILTLAVGFDSNNDTGTRLVCET